MQTDTTSQPDPARRWRLIAIVASTAAVLAIAVAAFSLGRGSQSDHEATFTASGTILIPCAAERIDGYEVEILDMSGKTLAKSVMGTGYPVGIDKKCAYAFVVRDVPAGGMRYYITVLAPGKYKAVKPVSVAELDLRTSRAEIVAPIA